jgi:hypothetical protein
MITCLQQSNSAFTLNDCSARNPTIENREDGFRLWAVACSLLSKVRVSSHDKEAAAGRHERLNGGWPATLPSDAAYQANGRTGRRAQIGYPEDSEVRQPFR